jgi:hypothetical protein
VNEVPHSPDPSRACLFNGSLEYIFVETDPDTDAFRYAFELWSCDEPIVIVRRKVFSTAKAALFALLEWNTIPGNAHRNAKN